MAYRSKFEKTVAAKLNAKGIGFKYEDSKFPYEKQQRLTKETKRLHGLPEDFKASTYHLYTVDFDIAKYNFHIEVKGRWVSSDRTKMIAIKEQHPTVDIRMWFQADNYIYPGSKSKYSDVCKRHNIIYHVGVRVPPWFEE
jgi:hypothetical protein